MLFPGSKSPAGKHAGAYDPRTSRGRLLLRMLLYALLLILLIWPFAEPWMLETTPITLSSADLPAEIGQLRIVYASDVHQGGMFTQRRVQDLVSRINACSADIVLLGGDYAKDSNSAIEFFRNLPRIHTRFGVYAVLGNHDRTIPESNLTTLRGAMISAGVTPLINDVAQVRIGMSSIYIAGIDDVNNGYPDLKGVAKQTDASDYVIFLSHSPAVIEDALTARDRNSRKDWFDLGLFGHTHGGQIAILGPLLKDDGVPNKYTSGYFRHNRTDMLVSRGVGTADLPMRFLCTPQIHLITVNTAK